MGTLIITFYSHIESTLNVKYFSGQKLGPVEREHHHADEETRPNQGRRHQDGPGVRKVDLRGHDRVQGRGVEVDRDPEDSNGRKDLRRGGEGQVDAQVGQDARKRRPDCQSCRYNARITGN